MELIACLIYEIVFVILAINVVYILFFSIAGLFNAKVVQRPILKYNRFAVFIPAYKGVNKKFIHTPHHLTKVDK